MNRFVKYVCDAGADFFSLIYPRTCVVCGEPLAKNEDCLCFDCQCKLPLTHYANVCDNEIERRMWAKDIISHIPTQYATAYLHFEKGNISAQILHDIKYHGGSHLGEVMGAQFGGELKGGRWENIDMLIPVPLHPKKMRIRGYNQSECICNGISQTLHKPVVTDVLIRTVANTTQTKKGVADRWQNVQGIFAVQNAEKVKGKHIAIVDDVLTTGATMEACIQAFKDINDVKISVLALAAAEK